MRLSAARARARAGPSLLESSSRAPGRVASGWGHGWIAAPPCSERLNGLVPCHMTVSGSTSAAAGQRLCSVHLSACDCRALSCKECALLCVGQRLLVR